MTVGEVTPVPKIGDQIVLRGRGYVVRGVTPASVTPPVVYLNAVKTGAALEVPLEQLELPRP
ncbi:MAG TPA: hypothetical protein VKR23_10385 [Gaiellaceae bacterium]|nr:hypothetical protein [Gaiellaceae bacterium]